jgi:rSAM/selenodomain-associated transferase 1
MSYRYPDARLMIFAKAPVAGKVKTRLIPTVGAEGAAELQRRLLDRTVAMACDAALAPVELWLAGDAGLADIQALLARYPVSLRQQQGGDLGARMHHAVASGTPGRGPAVIIGTDSPAMDATTLQQAFTALASHQVVFQPAEDGGYTLIGLQRACQALFTGIDWGTERVMAQSLKLAYEQGLSVAQLAWGWDLDRPDDYRRALAEGWIGEIDAGQGEKQGAG